jgi:hypothetical protein
MGDGCIEYNVDRAEISYSANNTAGDADNSTIGIVCPKFDHV